MIEDLSLFSFNPLALHQFVIFTIVSWMLFVFISKQISSANARSFGLLQWA